MTINFYNNFNNGDVHFARGLITQVIKYFPNCVYNFLHKNKKGILKDFVSITELDLNEKCDKNQSVIFYPNEIYINTWYGQNNFIFLKMGGGCTLQTIFLITKHILSILDKPTEFVTYELYPTINFDNLTLPKVNNGFNVLICNNNSLSGQANNVNLTTMIDVISNMFPEIIFYVTDKINLQKKNIIFTSDITNVSPDLLEISFISTKCNIIVGRSSGPYSFSILYENIRDNSKVFLALCNRYIEGIWDVDNLKCKYYHNPSHDIKLITNNLIDIINNYGK